jgi:hypothetical protein
MMLQLLTFARSKRALLGAAALACYATAIVLAPSDVRSQLAVGRGAGPAEGSRPAETPLTAVAPRGDAFAPRAEVDEDRAALAGPPALAPRRLLGQWPLQRDAMPATRVTAIATGALPSAIVESGGTAHVVTVGDALDGSQITSIDATSLTLANSRRLSLEAAAPAP